MKKTKQIPFWKTGRQDGKSTNGVLLPHVELYADLLQDPVFSGLSGSAYKTYLGMMKEHGFNVPDDVAFEFPRHKAALYGVPKDSLLRAIKELEAKGFIEVVQRNGNLRKANLYRFSKAWKGQPP